jgi:hypothetical protein
MNMKRSICVAIALGGLTTIASAQGYVGAVRSLTNVGFDCAEGLTCDKSSKGWRFYGGTKLAPNNSLDFGIGKVNAVEVSYMRFGHATLNGGSRQMSSYVYVGINGIPVTVTQSLSYMAEADATSVAAVAHLPIFDQFALSARLGLAYVSSTFRTSVDGRVDSSKTESKFKPYIGLGFEYDIPSIVKLVGSLDMTKYDVNGYNGSMRMIGLGAEKTF